MKYFVILIILLINPVNSNLLEYFTHLGWKRIVFVSDISNSDKISVIKLASKTNIAVSFSEKSHIVKKYQEHNIILHKNDQLQLLGELLAQFLIPYSIMIVVGTNEEYNDLITFAKNVNVSSGFYFFKLNKLFR